MKLKITLGICLCVVNSMGQKTKLVNDPTGTYKLGSKSQIKDGLQYGYHGEIKVKKLATNKIAISFYICKGAPSSNSGSFVDTLLYENNTAIYRDKYGDTIKNCTLILMFTKSHISLTETANYERGTCWGNGVVADGWTYRKVSGKIPVIKNLLLID